MILSQRVASLVLFSLAVSMAGEPVQSYDPLTLGAKTGELVSIVRRYEIGENKEGRLVRIARKSSSTNQVEKASNLSEQGKRVAQERSSGPWKKGKLDVVALVRQASMRHKVDPDLLYAVIRQESNFDPFAVSHRGALGLMQLMPQTAHRFGVKDIFDPAENVNGGAKFLRYLLDRYDGDQVRTLAAYNAGEAAVERHGGVPPYKETQEYIRRVRESYAVNGSIISNRAVVSSGMPRIVVSVGSSGEILFETETN
ncbi:MAG: hypothetical protein CMN58_06855 [Solibacterales bacterium]|nr:hypothetical protein [Bryobacterales bacterium]|tara:strand:+ start:304785 stop:305549 length:765 start_codon:yes stop_codon:yes gene_type:complete